MEKIEVLSLKDLEIIEEISPLKHIENFLVVGVGISVTNLKAIYGFLNSKKNFIFVDSLGFDFQYIFKTCQAENTCIIAMSNSTENDETVILLKNLLLKKFSTSICYVISPSKDCEIYSLASEYSENMIFFEYQKPSLENFSIFLLPSFLPLKLAGIDFENILINLSKLNNGNFRNNIKEFLDDFAENKDFIILVFDKNHIGFAEWLKTLISKKFEEIGLGVKTIISDANKDKYSDMYLSNKVSKLFYILPSCNDFRSEIDVLRKKQYKNFINKLIEKNIPIMSEQKIDEILIARWIDSLMRISK